ncbi:hypothetical protein MJO10_32395, partial [Salmonella enterica subsp. enterica serovar Anatum]|nr:hypothetical protein [Salmonella enterica subsp. enterica serovar Anatum]
MGASLGRYMENSLKEQEKLGIKLDKDQLIAGVQDAFADKSKLDLFVKYYKVDMTEAQKPDTASYRTFNDFFVRPLRDDVRPLNT